MRKILIATAMIVCLAVGYAAGVFHTKFQIAKAFVGAFSEIGRGVGYDPGERENVSKTLNKEKLDYLDKLLIRNIQMIRSGPASHAVRGELKNTGDRTLNEVEITVYFLDREGNPIFEERRYPVLVSDFSIDRKPLKPGYGEKFICDGRDAPSDWAKKVEVKVTDIKFAEEK